MKKIKLLTFFALFVTVAFTSCGVEPVDPAIDVSNNNGNNPDDVPIPINQFFKVDFGGQTFNATSTQAIVTNDYIRITGMKSTGEMFQISVGRVEEGTYTWDNFNLTPNNFAMKYMSNLDSSAFVGARDDQGDYANFSNYTDTAELVISDINTQNHTISGTFKFTGVRFDPSTSPLVTAETKVFTGGSFNLSYADNVTLPIGYNFYAKVDGANYLPTEMYLTPIPGSNKIDILGIGEDGWKVVRLTFPNTITVGTYPLSSFGTYVGSYKLDGTGVGSSFGASSGSMTISSHNTTTKRIKGTFSFTATSPFVTDVYSISEGSFDITYP